MRFRTSKLFVSVIPVLGLGAGIGFLSSIMGVGGGFIMVPALIYLLKVPTNVVIGTSLFQIIFVAAYTTIIHATANQTVDIVLAFLLMVGGVAGAQYGAKVGQRLRGEQLRALLAVLVLAVALRLGFDLFVRPQSISSSRRRDLDGASLPRSAASRLRSHWPRRFAQDDLEGVVRRLPKRGEEPPQPTNPESSRSASRPTGWRSPPTFPAQTSRSSARSTTPIRWSPGRAATTSSSCWKDRRGQWSCAARSACSASGSTWNSETFTNVPVSYSVATTRMPQDITDANSYQRLSLGADYLHIEPVDRDGNPVTIKQFRDALRERKAADRPVQRCASAASSSCRRACSAPRCRCRPASRSARTRRARSCSRTACSSRKARRSFDRQVGLRADHRPLRDEPRLSLRHLRDGSGDRHRLARPHHVPQRIDLFDTLRMRKQRHPASASRGNGEHLLAPIM